jgi:hypothetical protein
LAAEPSIAATKLEGNTMRKFLILTGAAVLAGSLSAWAAETGATTGNTTDKATAGHTTEQMTAGMHTMAGNKQSHMSNKVAPMHTPNCSEEALAKMPAEHRAACGKKD